MPSRPSVTHRLVAFRSLRPVVLLLVCLVAAPAWAQQDTTVVAEDPPTTRDIRLLHAIYDIDDPAFVATMRGVNWTSRPVFVGTAPALWLGILALDDERDFTPAFLLTLTEVGAVGIVFALKNVIRRPRPYASLADIAPRSREHGDEAGIERTFDPFSFPSGHAATSFAMATSLSLSYPKWYVIAPSMLYATAVSVSRPWLGVHYPTDVAVGAALGVGVAVTVHALGEIITPGGLTGSSVSPSRPDGGPLPPTVHFVIPF